MVKIYKEKIYYGIFELTITDPTLEDISYGRRLLILQAERGDGAFDLTKLLPNMSVRHTPMQPRDF